MNIRKIIEINEEQCDGCGQCILHCAENALAIVDGKAKVISDILCDGLGACLQGCPQNALTIIEREALPFDQEAVDALQQHVPAAPSSFAHISKEQMLPIKKACPSLQMTPKSANAPWPLKMRILPPESPFLNNAEIVLVSDCAPAVYTNFHGHFGNKVKISFCPKFEDTAILEQKLAVIIAQAKPKSLDILRMEVPCCAALEQITQKVLQQGNASPAKVHTCTRQGDLLDNSLLS